jgi:hypothetical protein
MVTPGRPSALGHGDIHLLYLPKWRAYAEAIQLPFAHSGYWRQYTPVARSVGL